MLYNVTPTTTTNMIIIFTIFIMNIIKDIVNIFKTNCNYGKINEFSDKQLRNKTNGISINDAIYYRFMYSEKSTTKQQIVSKINYMNNTSFCQAIF